LTTGQSIGKFATRLWHFLTEPHAAITDSEARYQARLLASTLLPLAIGVPILYGLRSSGYSTIGRSTEVYTLLVLLSAVVAYLISRTRHYQWGVVALVGGLIVFIMGVVITDRNAVAFQLVTLYFVPTLFIGSLFLGILPTFVLAVIAIGITVFLWTLIPDTDSGLLVNQLRYLGVMFVIIGCASYIRQMHRRRLRQREQNLLESESRYRSLFEATLEALLVHRDGVIIDANTAFERLTGYNADEMRGKTVVDFVHPDSRHLIRAVPNTAPQQSYELYCQRKDGSKFLAEILTKAHQYQGQPVRVVTFRDLTIQREAEAQRFEIKLQSELQQVQQQLIRHLSHDFRTPLSVIKTSLYLLERTTNDPIKHQKHVDVLRIQADRLQEMMDDFITLARLDYTRKADLDESLLDLDAFLREIHAEYATLAAKRAQTVSYTPTEPLGAAVIDEDSLRRVLKSLLMNAIAYTPEGGSITFDASLESDVLQLVVNDTGMGISPADMPHIFDHFYRSDPARDTEKGGSGLGLTIAQKLVEIMDGTISVESEVGAGSRFTVRLPVLQQQAAQDVMSSVDAL
jgi:PAS domain S-box-containing protein